MTDLETISSMLLRATIMYVVDQGHGWSRRLVLGNEMCFCFDNEGCLASVRSVDDEKSFDGRQ